MRSGLEFADATPQLKAILPASFGTRPQGGNLAAVEARPDGLLVDTSWVPPEDRFAYWQSASPEIIGPLRIERQARQPFNAQLFAYPLGPLTVSRVTSDAASIKCITKTTPTAEFLLVLVESGHLTAEGCGPEARLGPGDLLLCDWSMPYRIDSVGDEPFRSVTMSIPRSLLHPHQTQLRGYVGRRIPGRVGTGRLVSGFLRDLGDVLVDGSLVPDDFRLAESALDLTLALFLSGGASVQISRSPMLAQVKRHIEQRLGDPTLAPESIAQAHFISVRQLYKLFEGAGPSVAEWIRERRIECCRRDLADPSLAATGVMEIAARWGFTSPAHFSRTFRAAVGCSPRGYRNQMLYRNQKLSTCPPADADSSRLPIRRLA